MLTIMRARWVLPVDGPPIENGEVVVSGDSIVAVGPASATRMDTPDSHDPHNVLDLGDAVLLPGLVNVHTHLDYTVMRGLLEDIAFFPWIRELTMRKAALIQEDWRASAILGAAEAVAGGVTTIGDCTDSGAACLGAKILGMRGIIYQEVFGIDELRSVSEIVAELVDKVARLRDETRGTALHIGISPHSPYTVRPALMQALAELAQSETLPVCIHAAESRAAVRDGRYCRDVHAAQHRLECAEAQHGSLSGLFRNFRFANPARAWRPGLSRGSRYCTRTGRSMGALSEIKRETGEWRCSSGYSGRYTA